MSQLSQISDGIREAGARKERERLVWQASLPAPVLFIPDPENAGKGWGIGWFRCVGGFMSFRRMSNGYDPNSVLMLDDELIRSLHSHLPKPRTRVKL